MKLWSPVVSAKAWIFSCGTSIQDEGPNVVPVSSRDMRPSLLPLAQRERHLAAFRKVVAGLRALLEHGVLLLRGLDALHRAGLALRLRQCLLRGGERLPDHLR